IVYGAIAVAALLLGARWLKSGDSGQEEFGGVSEAQDSPSLQVDSGGGALVVHVAGEVRDPSVYRLPDGARVTDAIERAGGPSGDAAVDAINLAAKLADGQQVIMPATAESAAGVSGGAATATAGAEDGPISLGMATVEDLDTIEGIGPVTAADIVEYRD